MASALRLLPNAERRVRLGHAWIFSNEVDVARTPLTGFAPGELAEVFDARGKPVGVAYVNPGALISARLLSSNIHQEIDVRWFAGRLRRALALRERLYPAPYYRLVYGESDGLPGLVIDRYGDVLVAQLNTAGMHALRVPLLAAIDEVIAPRGIRVTAAGSVRSMEGLTQADELLGDVPDIAEVRERDLVLAAPLKGGQKTGYYFDQRDNRARIARYAGGKSVLDVYSYVGAWGVSAAKAGASSVVCVDASGPALAFARENAARNGVALETREGDALDVLADFASAGSRFDVIIVDPPALVKRKKDAAAGRAHYERLNRSALAVLAPDGILVSCSCSYHMDGPSLQRAILGAARAENRRAQLLERHGQPPDHPVHPAIPETEYLKAFFVRA